MKLEILIFVEINKERREERKRINKIDNKRNIINKKIISLKNRYFNEIRYL